MATSSTPEKANKEYDSNWLKGTSAESILAKQNKKSDFSDPVFKKLSRINGKINSMSMSELVDSLKELNLETKGKKEVLIRRLKNFHKETNLNNLNNPNFKPEKSFDYVCVIDFEATCSDQINNYPHEIIEFPIVLINLNTLKIEDQFQAYCKPTMNPKLTNFCVSLTGITQEQVDSAEEFPDVLDKVNEWLLKRELGTKFKFAVATDGPWDMKKFLKLQCTQSAIPYPNWAKKWIDIRKLFSNWFGVRRCGINKMLDYVGLEFEGNQHCGLHDSINIARILIKLASDGCKIKTNDKLDKPQQVQNSNEKSSNSDTEN